MKIGKNSRINMHCIVMRPWNITIGDNTMINEYALLDRRDKLMIGNSCSISMFSIIYTASHYASSPVFEWYSKPTTIGDCWWIGTNVIIMPGSRIADFTIIGTNSSFKGRSEEKGIYQGNPAIKIRDRKIGNQKYLLDPSSIGFFV